MLFSLFKSTAFTFYIYIIKNFWILVLYLKLAVSIQPDRTKQSKDATKSVGVLSGHMFMMGNHLNYLMVTGPPPT